MGFALQAAEAGDAAREKGVNSVEEGVAVTLSRPAAKSAWERCVNWGKAEAGRFGAEGAVRGSSAADAAVVTASR